MTLLTPALAAADVSIPAPERAVGSLGALISGIITASIVIGAIAAFIFLVLGGLQWITGGGDKANVEKAQQRITNAIIGLVIVAAAYAIITVVTQFLGLNLGNLTIPSVNEIGQ